MSARDLYRPTAEERRRQVGLRSSFSGPTLRLALLPLHVAAAAVPIEHARQNEQQIRQSIDVLPRCLLERLERAQFHQRALRAPAYGAANMRPRRRAPAPGP